MLERILAEFRKYDMPLSLALLSHALQMEQSVLEGMLQTLERKGRIVVVEQNEEACHCHDCPIQTICPPDQRWYVLAEG